MQMMQAVKIGAVLAGNCGFCGFITNSFPSKSIARAKWWLFHFSFDTF
jgi:hypothetical protein